MSMAQCSSGLIVLGLSLIREIENVGRIFLLFFIIFFIFIFLLWVGLDEGKMRE